MTLGARSRASAGVLFVAVVVVVAGCTTAPAPSARAPVADTWTAQSFEQRHDTMAKVVRPQLARVFQDHYGPKYELKCASCHGENPADRKFAMPADLEPLNPEHMPTADSGATSKFMITEVMPAAKEAMGYPGLTCFSCHPRKAP